MADVQTKNMAESYPVNGGNGPNSYAQNSCYQKEVVDGAKGMITKAIAEKFDIGNPLLDCPNLIRIADFGCSTGPNTFISVQNIIEAIELKHKSTQQNSKTLEFHVFFNDLTSNDFNTLFMSLPPSREYFAAGVPGSFHGRVFPKATLHIAHSSNSLHWLSKIPEEVLDRNSLAWSGKKVHYTGNEKVLEAYSAQFKNDMKTFLSARALEIVSGGVILFFVGGCEDGFLASQTCSSMQFGLLASCLVEMAELGMISEEKVESFNVPIYLTSPKELKEVIETNAEFSIERMENFVPYKNPEMPDCQMLSTHLRVVIEGLISEHFGTEIVEGLFERYTKKMEENYFVFDMKYRQEFVIFVCLKRK
ncbi:loganic acid O-methyltransferase-like [Cornus florida]|uniref:loganic acid O-methyltransferase-like n=1 Tax=Cornus florida TaxID=4283 RepID=UPI00289FB82C|nr:loganic acid O-methyltransferase-like [Cornus florida]